MKATFQQGTQLHVDKNILCHVEINFGIYSWGERIQYLERPDSWIKKASDVAFGLILFDDNEKC